MAFPFTQTINAPIEQAFDCVDDEEKPKIWVEGVEEIIPGDQWNPEDPVGSRFTQRIREGGRVGEYEGEIVAYDKPHHMGLRWAIRCLPSRSITASPPLMNPPRAWITQPKSHTRR